MFSDFGYHEWRKVNTFKVLSLSETWETKIEFLCAVYGFNPGSIDELKGCLQEFYVINVQGRRCCSTDFYRRIEEFQHRILKHY